MADANNPSIQRRNRIKVAWISEYPVEWMKGLPAPLQQLPRKHPATWLRVLVKEFQRRGDVEVHAITLRRPVRSNVVFEQDGSTYHVLKASGRGRVLSLFWIDTVVIRRQIRSIRPDLVHAWGTEYAAALVASRLGLPYLVTLQGLLEWYSRTLPNPGLFLRLMAYLEPVSLRRARVATTESSFGMRFLRDRYPELCLRQVEHAANEVFHGLAREPRLAPIRLVFLGTLGHRKGTDLLLNALATLANELPFELVMVSGQNQQYLEPFRTTLPDEFWRRVVLKADLSPEEVADELRQAALLILPTRCDTSPNAVKEAAVAGVPVVASEVGGIPDYIAHGKNGFLFAAGDQEALTQALRAAMTHPLFGKGRVDPKTWSAVREYLSPGRMAQNFFEAYQLVLETWNRPQPV